MIRCIKLYMGEHEIGRAYADHFVDMMPPNPFGIKAKSFYDDSFYGVEDSDTFEARFQRVLEGKYMCFSKPTLKLYAFEMDE